MGKMHLCVKFSVTSFMNIVNLLSVTVIGTFITGIEIYITLNFHL